MEYLVFGIVIVMLILFVFIQQTIRARKEEKEFIKSLYDNYGILPEREMKPERFARVSSYYERHKNDGEVDEITWNDLHMDDVFHKMNYCYSATGEEYLYYTLHNTVKSVDELEHMEEGIDFFQKNPDERVRVQLLMRQLGFTGKYSIYDYLENLDYLGERKDRGTIFRDLLFLPLIGMFFVNTSVAVIGIVMLVIYNITSYMKEKKEIEPYIISFAYIMRLIHVSEKISGMQIPALEKELAVIRQAVPKFRDLKFGLGIVMWQNTGNPLDILMDYLRMIFHFDIILFNRILRTVQKNVDNIDEMIGHMGYIETVIAVGALRKAMEGDYCIPQFYEDEDALTLEGAYHLLVRQPVKNSIRTERGVLVTGSNASGKSTFLRTVALNAILAQTIHTCAAESYRAPLYRIYSSMSLRDDIESGDSYYMVEIKSLKRILDAAPKEGRVLCFVDEVLRGTNTVERIAASVQILKSLAKNELTCFAATHDIELTTLLETEYDNYHFEEEIRDGDVLFDYQLLPGRATTRNAIRLLEIIGYDEGIIKEADELASHFMQNGSWI